MAVVHSELSQSSLQRSDDELSGWETEIVGVLSGGSSK